MIWEFDINFNKVKFQLHVVLQVMVGVCGGVGGGGITETYERVRVCNYGYFLLRAPGKDFEIDSIFKELTIHEHILCLSIYLHE